FLEWCDNALHHNELARLQNDSAVVAEHPANPRREGVRRQLSECSEVVRFAWRVRGHVDGPPSSSGPATDVSAAVHCDVSRRVHGPPAVRALDAALVVCLDLLSSMGPDARRGTVPVLELLIPASRGWRTGK